MSHTPCAVAVAAEIHNAVVAAAAVVDAAALAEGG